MKTNTTKFLAVLAILAMAFALVVSMPATQTDATGTIVDGDETEVSTAQVCDQNAPDARDLFTDDTYKVSERTIDADGFPTYTVTIKGLKTHLNANQTWGNWAGLGLIAPDEATVYKAFQLLTAAAAKAVTPASFTGNWTAVESLHQFYPSGDEAGDAYTGFCDWKSAQDYYQVFVWATADGATITQDDIVIYHVILDVTPQTDSFTLPANATVKGEIDNGIVITAAGTETFVEFTGTITIGKSIFEATDFSGTIVTTVSDSTAVAQIGIITDGTLELASGTFTDQTITSITKGNLVIGKNVTVNFTADTLTVTEGDIQLKAGATVTFKALTLTKGDLSIAANAQLTATGAITMTGDLLVRGTLVLTSTLGITGNGSIYGVIKSSADGTVRTITVNAPGTAATQAVLFKAYDGSSLLYVSVAKGTNPDNVTIDLSGSTSTVYLHGTISTSQTYGQTQNVVVDGDLEIKDGAVIKINGGFLINDGCRLTVTYGTVTVAGAGVDVAIDGDIYVDEKGTFTVNDGAKSVKINGIVENGGTMTISTLDVTVAKDGKMIINDLAKATTLTKITVAAGGLLQIGGNISASEITNKGSVVFNEAVLVGDVTVIMNANDSLVSILSATNGKSDANASVAKITVTDDGMTIASGYTQTYFNKIEISTSAATGAGFSGIGIAQSVTTSSTYKTVASKFTVAGNFGVVGDEATAIMDMGTRDETTKANFAFADGFTVGPGTTVNVNYLTPVDYDMYVVGASGSNATLTGYLTVNGVIAGNSYATITDTVETVETFSAAKFSVGLSTDVVKYYASIENAVEILEDYTDPISLTILGKDLVVDESVTIPSNISLKGNGTFTIGTEDDNDVIMEVENGSSISSGLTIYVLGTLYLENAKDLKTTSVYADVKTTDGTALCYTNLYTALANAEAGDIVEVTADELEIIKSIIVPEGVVLYIPAGVDASVKVANKVTITVNGVLSTGGIVGPFGDKVSETAAVLVVNGVFMTSETDKPADANTVYKAAGAYYFISDDVGDFVYISSLADGAETAATAFYIYGTVTEIAPIELTSKTVTITEGAELIAAAITLSKSTIDVTLGELTAVIYGGDGVSSLAVTDFVFGQIKDKYNSTDKVNELSVGNIGGTVVIMTGTVFTNAANVDADDESSFTVMPGAIFYIPVDMVTYLDSSAAIMGDVVVAGTLFIKSEDVVVTGDITVLADSEEGIHGTLNVSAMSFVSGVITVMDDATFNLTGTITAGVEPTELGAAATIIGNVTSEYAIIAYPGADMDGMTINNKEPVSTEFYINDELFMTVYSAANKVLISNVISVPDYEFPDYKVPTDIKTDVTLWGATATTKVGDVDSLSIELDLQDVVITTSWANGLALYIDSARIMSATATLTVGIHTVSASVNAGYACDNMTITFNGVAVPVTKEGTVIVLAVDDAGSILAVSGDVYIPEPEPVTPEEKSEWTITTILLVILVILIAIMAVIVALRLNRS